jgi:hypothetical protein
MDTILYPKSPESFLTRPSDKVRSNYFWQPIPEVEKNGEVMLVFSRKKVKEEDVNEPNSDD